jgi:hypothetical protein
MESLSIQSLQDRMPVNMHELERAIKERRLSRPRFYACFFDVASEGVRSSRKTAKPPENVFLLFFDILPDSSGGNDSSPGPAYLSQVHTELPKKFKTPHALMGAAHRLGLTEYTVDATHWTASHYDLYKKQAEILREKTRASS